MAGTHVDSKRLRITCDPASLGFRSTAKLAPLKGTIGQDSAIEAILLAAQMPHKGFNLAVGGPEGSGRHSTVLGILQQVAAARPTPPDWVYLQNFADPEQPLALSLPTGDGPRLREAMSDMVADLADRIPAVMISDAYQSRRMALDQDFASRNEAAFATLSARAGKRQIVVLKTPTGFSIAATRDGEILTPEAIEDLPRRSRARIEKDLRKTQDELEDFLVSMPEIARQQREALASLNAAMAEKAVRCAMARVERRFSSVEGLQAYFTALRADLIQNAGLFLAWEESRSEAAFPGGLSALQDDPRFHRYGVNVIVTHDPARGAPVVVETLPMLANLCGQVDYMPLQGALVTDFTQIRPGALHRANGGFLVLDARRLLSEPFAWETLKRCLETEAIHITTGADRLGLVVTTMMTPEPVPLDLRVVLIGEREFFAELAALDPEFAQFFRISAEFAGDMPRSKVTLRQYAAMVAAVAKKEDLRPVSAKAVAALIDEATREAEDQAKLCLHTSPVLNLLREADHLAAREKAPLIEAEHVDKARAARERRLGLTRARVQEMMRQNRLLVSTSGSAIGQVNGLTIADLGTARFGAPVRITARVRMGRGRVVDIEREARTGGPLHSKAVLILSGFLAGRYAPDVPLSLWASLVFEQNYGLVEGDSASLAETCALMSALAEVPISQSFAVTGSVNQMGEVQPVGGINDKIEGFFDLCKIRGLTGRQGVIIPEANRASLMLKPDLVAAVADQAFQVHAVSHVDQAISLLTGLPAGARSASGEFDPGSINANIEIRLLDFARARARAGDGEGEDWNG